MPVILVADDDPDLLPVISDALAEEGWVVLAAASSSAAVEIVRSNHVDVALLDLSLADGDDRSLRRCLQTDRRPRALPVVFMTGSSRRDTDLEGENVLLKPFDLRQTIAALDAAMSERRMSVASAPGRGATDALLGRS